MNKEERIRKLSTELLPQAELDDLTSDSENASELAKALANILNQLAEELNGKENP